MEFKAYLDEACDGESRLIFKELKDLVRSRVDIGEGRCLLCDDECDIAMFLYCSSFSGMHRGFWTLVLFITT